MNESNQASRLNNRRKSHYSSFLGEAVARDARSSDGGKMPIEILTFPPTESRPHYLVVTNGLSNFIQPGPHDAQTPPRIELMLYSTKKPKLGIYETLDNFVEGPYTQTRCVNSGCGITFSSFPDQEPLPLEDIIIHGPYKPNEFEPMAVDGEETCMMLLAPFVKNQGSASQPAIF